MGSLFRLSAAEWLRCPILLPCRSFFKLCRMGLGIPYYRSGMQFRRGGFVFGFRKELLLEQRNVNAVNSPMARATLRLHGHRSRSTYALTHLAPTKHYQCLA